VNIQTRAWGSRAVAPGALALWVVLAAAGCGEMKLGGTLLPNQAPTVELTQIPASADTDGTYAYEVSWAGFDADGRVVRFWYTVDPPSRANAETVWVKTTTNRQLFIFRSDSVSSGAATHARGFHTVVVKCEDDRGALSPLVTASFTSTTVTPTVQILLPLPNKLLARVVAPAIHINWQGIDPDGLGTTQPVAYRWRLFSNSSEWTPAQALADPDSLRRFYAPSFAGWDSVGGDVRSAGLRDLVPGHDYLFVVVAIDQAGAYSPVFSANDNMLQFRVDASASLGPQITVDAPGFTYTFPSGGVFVDPSSAPKIEVAATVPMPFSWSAKPVPGGFIRGYRWAIDLARLDDGTPRSDEVTDTRHWSRLSTTADIVLPPAPAVQGSETHLLYLEAVDDLDLHSLGVLQFTAVRPTFDRPLLIVDDTFFFPDRVGAGGCPVAPSRAWPTAAEFDTFLFAAGDKPYRCYPSGTRSPVGVFAGYDYDTVGTHFTHPGELNLTRLDRYRDIVWMTDITSAFTYEASPFTTFEPMPLLREWCSPSTPSPLVTWLRQGGRLWLMGGGAAMASLRPWDKASRPSDTFSSSNGVLGPGRLMYDNSHWRSEIRVLRSIQAVRSARAVGGWPGAPDYSALPPLLMGKSPETDPLPPLRTANFYLTSYAAEHLHMPNDIAEDGDPDPSTFTPVSTLDTLYETLGGQAGSGWPVMTVYHGSENPLFVFSGFPVWYFQRSQTIELVDFVLQRLWGHQRRPVPR
jgi:hypothetical protein